MNEDLSEADRQFALNQLETLSGTELSVCQEIAKRQGFGRKKYGTTVAENPLSLRQWMNHAREEALDLAVYLTRAIEELDKMNPNKNESS